MEAALEAYQILKGKKGFDIQNHALKTGKPVWFKTRIVTWGPWIQTGNWQRVPSERSRAFSDVPQGRQLLAHEHLAVKSGQRSCPAGTSHLDGSGYDHKADVCTVLSCLLHFPPRLSSHWRCEERLCWGDTQLLQCCGPREGVRRAQQRC